MKRRPDYDVDGNWILDTILGFDGDWNIIDRFDDFDAVSFPGTPETTSWWVSIEELQFNPSTVVWRIKTTEYLQDESRPSATRPHRSEYTYTNEITERQAISWWLEYGDTPSALRKIVAKEFAPEITEYALRLKPNKRGKIIRYLASNPEGVTMDEFLKEGLTESTDPMDVERALRRHSNEALVPAGFEIVLRPKIRIQSLQHN